MPRIEKTHLCIMVLGTTSSDGRDEFRVGAVQDPKRIVLRTRGSGKDDAKTLLDPSFVYFRFGKEKVHHSLQDALDEAHGRARKNALPENVVEVKNFKCQFPSMH